MTQPTPQGETPVQPTQPVAPVEPPASNTQPPASEQPEEPFDKDRAMKTINNLREVEKQAKKDAKELEALRAKEQQRAEAELTESQKLQKQNAEIAAENARLKAEKLQREVAEEANLPSIFADRIKGATKEEMLLDAKKLAEALPKEPTKKVPPRVPPTNPDNANANETEAQKRERLFGKQGNIFDMGEIQQRGGGVRWVTPPNQQE